MLLINLIKYIFNTQRSTIASVHLVKMEELATKCLGNTTVPVLLVTRESTVKQVHYNDGVDLVSIRTIIIFYCHQTKLYLQ